MCWGVDGGVGKCWGRCGKVCGGYKKILGEVWESVLRCGEGKGKCRGCGEVCWGIGKCVEGMGKCVGVWREV